MIPNYTRPQSTIAQLLRVTPDRVVNRQNTINIGPQYKLVINDGRKIPSKPFAAAGATLPYESYEGDVKSALNLSDFKVDTKGVKLFGENLEAEIGNIDGFVTTTNGAANRITLPNTGTQNVTGAAGANVLHPNMDGRDIRIGDVLQITVDNSEAVTGTHVVDETFYRKVVGFVPRALDSSVSVVASAATNFANAVATNLVALSAPTGHAIAPGDLVINGDGASFFVNGGRFGTQLGEELTITCTSGGAPGAATYSVAYTAAGTQEVVVSSDNAGKFQLTLANYDGSQLSLDLSGSAVTTATAGDTYKVRLFPVHAANAATTLTTSGAYSGNIDTSYVVEVTKGSLNNAGVTSLDLRVFDTQDSDIIQNYTITGSQTVPLGTKGLSLVIDTNAAGTPDFAKSDKFIFDVQGAESSTTENVGLVLDGPAFNPASFNVGSGSFRVSVREPFTGELDSDNAPTGEALIAADGSASYIPGLSAVTAKQVAPRALFVDGRGEVKLSYRAAVRPKATEGPIAIDEPSDITALGEINVLNDLAFAADVSFKGAQEGLVYALRTADDTVESFRDALRKIESSDIYYYLAVISENPDVMELVAQHCVEQSTPERKRFRRCYTGTDVIGAYEFLGKRANGTSRKSTVAGDVLSLDADDIADTNFTSLNIKVGDEVRYPALGTAHRVTEILSASELRISNVPAEGITPAVAFTIWKLGNSQDAVDFVGARSSSLDTRRCTNVWIDSGLRGTLGIPARFLAAEIAGIRSALLPQQGLTYTELNSIDSAPAMYTKYTPDQLDEAAAAGVMIVTQESEGGAVFIRHQLTTETDDGILAWEDNIGIIVDAISFQIKDSDTEFIGKKNVVQRTLDALENQLTQICINATQATLPENEEIGPMIVNFSDEDGVLGRVTVRQHPTLADRVIRYVKISIPSPLNNIDTTVDAEIAFL